MWLVLAALSFAGTDVPAIVLTDTPPQGLSTGQRVLAVDVRHYGDSLDPRDDDFTMQTTDGQTWTLPQDAVGLQIVATSDYRVYIQHNASHSDHVVLTDAHGRVLDRAPWHRSHFTRVRVVDGAALHGADVVFSLEATRMACPGGFSGSLFAVRRNHLEIDADYGGYGEAGSSEFSSLYVPVRRRGQVFWHALDAPGSSPWAGTGQPDRLLFHDVEIVENVTTVDRWRVGRARRKSAFKPE